MTVTTDKIADTVAARADAARHIAQAKAAQARARADQMQAKMSAKMASKAAMNKAAMKAGAAKGAAKLAAKSSAARSAAKVAVLNVPTAWLIGERLDRAGRAARKASKQARVVMQDKVIPTVVPMASTAMDQAAVKLDEFMTASAPARKEAVRRGLMAAAALRGVDTVVVKKRRRWPVAVACMAVGGAVGAAAAWLSQAGKPVQLTPYPMPTSEADQTVDLTSDENAHHES
jgi:hypothetical protein